MTKKNNKPNLLIPMAGKGQRFVDQNFIMPKPLIMVKDKHHLDLSMSSINFDEFNLIFVVRDEHIVDYNIDSLLKEKYGDDIQIVSQIGDAEGCTNSCMLAADLIDNSTPLIIYTLDSIIEPAFSMDQVPPDSDGMVVVCKTNSKNYSYIKYKDDLVTETKEKEVISDLGITGVYYFKSGKLFMHYANEMVSCEKHKTLGEYYLAPIYNLLIRDGLKVKYKTIEKMHVIGTPEELSFYKSHVLAKFGEKPVALACDHSGFQTKKIVMEILDKLKVKYTDYGTFFEKDCDQYDYLIQAIEGINQGFSDFGMGFCRTGQGFNIIANKQEGIRSALVYDKYTTEFSIRHNAANFFCIPEHNTSVETIEDMVLTMLNSTFDGGRHASRIAKSE
jgi:RpiB/LacA/LacB family sugar-phosphate isomerase